MRVFSQLRSIIVVLAIVIAALVTSACQPQNAALPTLVPLDGSAGTTAPDEPAATIPLTETPEPTVQPNTPTPMPFLGQFATDPDRVATFDFIHAASGTEPVDVYIDSETLTYGLAFKLDTGRTPLLSGSYTVRVTSQGGSPERDVLVSADFSVRPGESKFVVLNGTPDALSLQVFSENNAPLDAGKSRLTFVHTVPRLPDTAPAIDGTAISEKIAFSHVSPSFVVREQTGGVGLQDEFQTFASREMDLRARGSYTFILVGDSADPDSLTLMSYEVIVPQRVSLRVINVTQNIGAVDVYLDSLLLGGNVDVTRMSETVDATTNARLISVYPAGADRASVEPLLRDVAFAVENTTSTHSLVVMGDANSLRVVAVPEDLSPIRPDYARFVFVNALPRTPSVRVGGLSELFDDVPELQYGRFSPPVLFSQGVNRFFWREIIGSGEEGAIVERNDDFSVEAGRSYIYLLTGREDGVAISFSEPLTIDPALAIVPVNATPGAEDVQPKIRFINALDSGATINIVVDNTGTPIPLAYAQSSAIIPLASQTFGINVQAADTGLPLRTDTVTLQAPGTNTLVIYGDSASFDVRFLAISDKKPPTLESTSGARLINLTRDQRLFFGLRLGDATDPTIGTVGGPVEGWPTLPIGASLLTTGIGGNSASSIVTVVPGLYDVQVYDVQRDVIGQVVRGFAVSAGVDYDVVAFEMLSAPLPEIRAFVVPYPQP